jgi:biopolymer transport protein ExbD
MASIPLARQPQNGAGKPPTKRLATHIDFTPMVDLGFLLITFFMLTTVLAKPVVMKVVMPDDANGTEDPVPASKALTLLLGASDRVYWYEGLDSQLLDSTTYSEGGLRRVILGKMEKVRAQWGLQAYQEAQTKEPKQGSRLNVIIKPMENARYKNLVDALDEMAICRVRYYCILPVSEAERASVEQFLISPKTYFIDNQ